MQKKANLLYALSVIIIIITFIVDANTPLGIADWVGYIPGLLLLYTIPDRKYLFIAAAVSSTLIITGFLLSPSGIPFTYAVINRGVAIGALWLITYMMITRRKAEETSDKLVEELTKALSEIKTLSGFLPICSSCKKIRNDEGYWEQLEAYITEHSGAEFTHSICPSCAEKLYPQYFSKMKEKEPE